MTRRARISWLLCAALVAFPGADLGAQGARVGIGVGIGTAGFSGELGNLVSPTVYIPIVAGERIMIEPSIGILRLSTSDDFDDTEETVTVLSIGAGLLFLSSAGDQDHVYFGPRIGIVQVSSSYSEPGFSDDDSNTSVKIGGAIGGQFFLRQRFSLGAEVGLSWWNVDFPGTDLGLLSTNAELRARWYFR